tara:strand:+ start:5041 stop:5340 length:300 start_codon:yes stop_codon:yes gene_type:complete
MRLLYATFPSEDEALSVGKMLVEEKLIACMNLLGQGNSVFLWKDKINEEQEYYAIFKTAKEFHEVEKRFLELHSYDTPCLIEIPVGQVAKMFAEWIESQ